MVPSQFPTYDLNARKLLDGYDIPVCSFCKKAIVKDNKCRDFYRSLATANEGYYQCPYGLTARSFHHNGAQVIVSGVVAFPRFNSSNEQLVAKRHPENKVSRKAIESLVAFLKEIDARRADAVFEGAQVLPQALHEMRKLNGAILQHAEKELRERGESTNLLSIQSGAELMRNNFDILEALSNIDGMRALPMDSTINLYDLLFKMKKVYQERATQRKVGISVNGVRAIIPGSQKSFPIVPAVLIENAIKYAPANTVVRVDIEATGSTAILSVENRSDSFVDTIECFERGVRFSEHAEGGGYGLYIAKEIVACHKGTITCTSEGGTITMRVVLPLNTVIAPFDERRSTGQR